METNNSSQPPLSKSRQILAFPNINDLYHLLMDRVHHLLWRYYMEDKDFFIFIFALSRDHKEGEWKEIKSFEGVQLINAGIRRLRELFEGDNKDKRVFELDAAWDTLEEEKIPVEDTIVGNKLFADFDEEGYGFDDIEKFAGKTLSNYFESFDLETANALHKAEHAILKHHIKEENFGKYRYLSLPLIQFNELDGVVHIIYHESDEKVFFQPNEKDRGKLTTLRERRVGNLIKGISNEYEGMILDSDNVDFTHRERTLEHAFEENSVTSKNPLLQKLEYTEYYKRYKAYFLRRFQQSREVPYLLKEPFHQVAILRILIDSYAHNISAHSLSYLQWIFRRRAYLPQIKAGQNPSFLSDANATSPLLLEQDANFDREIHSLLRMLWEKGAYWSGLIRDFQFGGKISSLYSVLWYDFINNPFYLGSIAASEGIQRINLHITVFKAEENKQEVHFKKRVIADGVFAKIDLNDPYGDYDPTKDDKGLISRFVHQGDAFKKLEPLLKKYRAFFPGGVVGKHAFFTILENEIRNVKHYAGALEEMRKNGLTLNLTIEEDTYHTQGEPQVQTGRAEYYKMGVFIRQTTYIKTQVEESMKSLDDDIIKASPEANTYSTQLGGLFQNKICAAMLMNNTFGSVQNKNGSRYERFFPWVKLGIIPEQSLQKDDLIEMIETSARKYFWAEKKKPEFQAARETFDEHFKASQGKPVYFLKIFHLWKGEDVLPIPLGFNIDESIENPSRFRFLTLPENEWEQYLKIRALGIYRILRRSPKDHIVASSFEDWEKDKAQSVLAYNEWLKIWKGSQPELIRFIEAKGRSGEVIIDEKTGMKSPCISQMEWTGKQCRFRPSSQMTSEEDMPWRDIVIRHGGSGEKIGIGSKELRYRTHGILGTYFMGGEEFGSSPMSDDKACELLELLTTRIGFFDRRIKERFNGFDPEKLTEQLRCSAFDESAEDWKREQEAGLMRYNFLIIHHSFFKDQMEKTGIKSIGEFIQKEIAGGKPVPENFVLVLTSGMGRDFWWKELQTYDREHSKELAPGQIRSTSFVTFRPIESLISTIENAVTMGDDIELKYRLVKTFFGS
ncbi:MAG: hypothetical protein ACKVT2_19940 [Saprospiraceae bacterium]